MALSRARSLSGLIVDTLPTSTTVDPVVERFMEETFGEREDGEALDSGGLKEAVR